MDLVRRLFGGKNAGRHDQSPVAPSPVTCPCCGAGLDPPPRRSRRCPRCRERLVLLRVDGAAVLLTVDGAQQHEEEERRARRRDVFVRECAGLGIEPNHAFSLAVSSPANEWPEALTPQLARSIAQLACDSGDHQAELRVLEAQLGRRLPDPFLRDTYAVARALGCRLDVTDEPERTTLARRTHAMALEAIELASERMDRDGTRPATKRDNLDPWVTLCRRAEMALGLEPSKRSADLSRRERAREMRKQQPARRVAQLSGAPTTIWRRDAKAYWHDYYARTHGEEPPEGWWWDRPNLAAGGQVNPSLWREFGQSDRQVKQAFFEEMRRRHLAENPGPERWVSEATLAQCVAEVLPGHEVIRQARPDWLGTQRLDVYVPSLALAFEYQGEQHYMPLDHLGGEEGLASRRMLDEAKRCACRGAGVRLIEWRYDRDISVEAVRRRLGRLAGARDGDPASTDDVP